MEQELKNRIEHILKQADIHYVYVPKIKGRHGFTGRMDTIEDCYFIWLERGDYSRPYFLLSIHTGDDIICIHRDFDHPNVGYTINSFGIPNTPFALNYLDICTPLVHIIYNDPLAADIIASQMSGHNKRSPLRSCRLTGYDNGDLRLSRMVSMYKATSNPIELITGTSNINSGLTTMAEFKNHIQEEGYYIKLKKETQYRFVKDLPPAEEISSYYPVFTTEELRKIVGELPREHFDVGVFGCGSANSGIIYQLARCSMFNKFLLLDFDSVELKNIRNQIHTNNALGSRKTYSMGYYILATDTTRSKTRIVRRIDDRVENKNFTGYEFDYLLVGFDNIEAREVVLNKIKSGEIKTKYLIDTRYQGLTSSLYFIDVSKSEQLKFYEEQLLEDKKLLENKTEENTCNIENVIPIYTYTGSWVTNTIIQLECDLDKPYSWVELSTETNPNAIVMR